MVSSVDQSMLSTDIDADVIPFLTTLPVRKTLPRGLMKDGLMNTAPHVLVEGFRHQNLAISVLIVSVDVYAPVRRRNYLLYAAPMPHRCPCILIHIILVEITMCGIHIADWQPSKPRSTAFTPVFISVSRVSVNLFA